MKANEPFMSENLISTNEIRLRLVDLGCKSLTEQEFKSKEKKMYIEEYGYFTCLYIH